MVMKYDHRRVSPQEMWAKMKAAGLKMRDFLFLTGRRREQVEDFLSEAGRPSYTPTMGDVLIVEMAIRHPETRHQMMAIANEYSQGAIRELGATVQRR